MKQYIKNLIWEAQRKLETMKKEKMSLKDRVNYEKALMQLTIAQELLQKFDIS